MPILSRIFRRNASAETRGQIPANTNARLLLDLAAFIDTLLAEDSYIARSRYLRRFEEARETVAYFENLRSDGLLSDFCKKNGILEEKVSEILGQYAGIKNLVTEHNERFISGKLQSEKSYLDTILSGIDPAIMLDDDQRKVVLTDEDYCLVIAGAGAGNGKQSKNDKARTHNKFYCNLFSLDFADIYCGCSQVQL